MKKIRAFLGFLSVFVFTVLAANPAFAADGCDTDYHSIEVYCPNETEPDINNGSITCDSTYDDVISLMQEGCDIPDGYEINSFDITLWDGGDDYDNNITCTSEPCDYPSGEGTIFLFDAISSPIEYNIQYNLDNGTNPSNAPKTCTKDKGTELYKPTREGYNFDGWYYEKDFKNRIVDNMLPSNKCAENINVYAKWVETHTVYYVCNFNSWSRDDGGNLPSAVMEQDDFAPNSTFVKSYSDYRSAGTDDCVKNTQQIIAWKTRNGTELKNITTISNMNDIYDASTGTYALAPVVQDITCEYGTPTVDVNNKPCCKEVTCPDFYEEIIPAAPNSNGLINPCTPQIFSLISSDGKNTLIAKYNAADKKWYNNENEEITKITPPTQSGYTFVGYYKSLGQFDRNATTTTEDISDYTYIDKEGNFIGTPSDNIYVYQNWAKNYDNTDITITYDNDKSLVSIKYTCNNATVNPTDGYTCSQCTGDQIRNQNDECVDYKNTYTFFFFETVEEADTADNNYSYPQGVIDAGLTPILTLTFDRTSTETISDILNRDDVKAALNQIDIPYYINEQWVDHVGNYPSEDSAEITVQDYLSDGEDKYFHSSFYIDAELPRCNDEKQYIKTNGTCGECTIDGTKPSAVGTSFANTCVKKDYYTCDGTFDPNTGNGLTCAATEYEITYLANGKPISPDDAPTKCTVDSDDITLPTGSTVDEYKITGWKDSNNQSVTMISKGACTSDKTFTAELTLNAPKLTYNLTLPVNSGFSGGKLTVTWLDGEKEKTETLNLATTIQQYITYDSYNLPIPTLPGGFKFIGWFSDENYTTPISTINNSGNINVYGKVEPILFTIIAGCDLKDENNNSIKCYYNSLNDFHDECTVEKLEALCNDTDSRGYVLKDWVFNGEKVNSNYLGWLSKGAEIKLNANYVQQYNICIKNPTDTTQCQNNNATCFADDDVRYPVYAGDVAAEGKVYSGIVKIGVGTRAEYDDEAKALTSATPGNDFERINFTCSSDLVNTADNTIYIEYQYCSACAENTTATCTAAAVLNRCSYNYTCNTGYEVPSGMQSDDDKSFSVLDDDNKQCLPKSYTVKFNGNQGTGDGQCSAGITGETVDIIATVANGTPVINGYTCQNKRLLGWSADKNATGATYFDNTIKLNQTDIENYSDGDKITLYAIWVNQPVYTVNYSNTYNNIAGTWNEEPTKTSVVSGGSIQLPSDNSIGAPLGYKLAGWNVCNRGDFTDCTKYLSDVEITINNDIWIAPNFEEIEYQARFLSENGSLFTSPTVFKITKEKINTPNNGPEKTGYTFDKWCIQQNGTASKKCYAAGSEISVSDIINSANTENYVYFNPTFNANTYVISINPNSGTFDDGTAENKTIYLKYANGYYTDREYANKIDNFPTVSRIGYTFDGWKDGAGNPIEVTGTASFTADTRITAQWKPIVYTVTVNWNGNLVNTGDTIIFNNQTIYEKYEDAWYSDNAATNVIKQLDIPSNDKINKTHTFDGLWFNNTQVFNQTGAPMVNNYTFNQNGTDVLTAKWNKRCTGVKLFDVNTADNSEMLLTQVYYSPVCNDTTCSNKWYSDNGCTTEIQSLPTNVNTEKLYTFRGYADSKDSRNYIFDVYGKPTEYANNFNGNALYSIESNQYTISFHIPVSSGYNQTPANITYTASNTPQDIGLTYLGQAGGYMHTGWKLSDQDNNACNRTPVSYKVSANKMEDFTLEPCSTKSDEFCPYDENTILTPSVKPESSFEQTTCTYTCKNGYIKNEASIFTMSASEISKLESGEKPSCDPMEYTVKFDAGDGSFKNGTPTDITVTMGSSTPSLGTAYTPTRAGYTFKGWFFGNVQVYSSDLSAISYTWEYANKTGAMNDTITLTAGWVANQYNIEYNVDGGTMPETGYPKTCTPDETISATSLPTPGRTGYSFDGWYLGNTKIDAINRCVENLTLKAKWAANQYEIEFDANGGTMEPSEYKPWFTYDAPLPSIDVRVTKTDHNFVGWFADGDIQYYDKDNNPIATVVSKLTDGDSLIAKWTEKGATNIILNYNGGQSNGYDIPSNCRESSGNQYLPTANQLIAPTGHTFSHWTDENNNVVTTFKCGASELKFTAQWDPNTFTVTFNGNGATNGSMSSQEFTYAETEPLNNNQFTRTGYTFSGWATTQNGEMMYDNSAEFSTESTGDNVTLYAVWKPNTYTVKFDKNSNFATGNMDDQMFTYDTEQYLSNLMFMRHGYIFTGWKDANGNIYPVDQPVKNLTNEKDGTVTLYAQWTAVDWPVMYVATEGKCNREIITDTIKFDSEYIISNPDGINCPGYEITGWTDSYSNKTYNTGDKLDWGSVGTDSMGSRFMPILDGIDYTISYMCNKTSTAKDTQTVTMGEYTDLAQGASLCQKPGYKFTYWSDSDGNTYTSGAQWNTPNDVKLYANYETSTDTTLVYMDGGFEPVSCNAESSEINFRELTNTGYEYEGWYICNNETNTPEKCGNPVLSIPAGQCTFTSGNDSGKTMYLYPAMTARTFEIAFKCGDMGSITDAAETMQVTYGQPFTFPKYNTKCDDTGRTFRGWTSGGKEYKAGQTIAEWTDINLMTFNAVWDTVKFTIKFDANGGSGNAPTSISCEYGTIKNSCSAPSYNGMTNGTKYFVGWAYGKDATNPDFEASNSLATAFDTNDTHTLYAVWHECIMPEYDENHVSGIDISVNNNSCQYAAKCKAGYFNPTISDSWADCTTCPDNSSTSDNNSAKYCTCNTGYEFGTNNQTTTNACSAKEYKIQYGYVNGLDTDNLPTTYKYGVGTKIPSLTKTGYDFIGWCTDSSETDCKKDQQVSDTETGDKTFWAKFKPITFTIWYDPNGGNKPENKAYYTTCTYDEYCETADNVFTKQGYEFKTWNLDKTNNHYSEGQDITNLFNTKSVDHSFYATWAACTSQTAGDCDCDATQHPENGQCLDCLKQCSGEYSDGEYNICNGETAEESCKRDIDKIEIENSIFVNGTITLGGLKEVSNLQCSDGYYPSDDKLECLPCMAGHYCPSGQGAQTCPATHPKSSVGAISDDECYQTCSDSEIEGFVYQAASDKEYFDTKCQYSKVVTSVGTCAQDEFDMDARTCNRYETCKPGYRLIAGQCELCGIENAVSYSSGCMVQTCVNGYHPMADSCVDNTVECNAENATIATQTWDEKKNRFGICTIVECDSDYHIENNTCVLNYRACETTNGSGSQEWQSNNTWGNCIADKCDPGFELNGKNCTPCTNGNGVSSWTDGCTIATCMYQGARYNLENNECIEICSETGLTDFTGTRKWNSSTKKCETTCAAGYKSW